MLSRPLVVGQFHNVNFTAEPGGLPAVGRHLPPGGQAAQTPRGRCHGARRELPIFKMTYYSVAIDLLRAPPYHLGWGACCYGLRLSRQEE